MPVLTYLHVWKSDEQLATSQCVVKVVKLELSQHFSYLQIQAAFWSIKVQVLVSHYYEDASWWTCCRGLLIA